MSYARALRCRKCGREYPLGPLTLCDFFFSPAAGSSPIVNAFKAGILHVHPVKLNTIAKSIAVGNPADGYYAVIARRVHLSVIQPTLESFEEVFGK